MADISKLEKEHKELQQEMSFRGMLSAYAEHPIRMMEEIRTEGTHPELITYYFFLTYRSMAGLPSTLDRWHTRGKFHSPLSKDHYEKAKELSKELALKFKELVEIEKIDKDGIKHLLIKLNVLQHHLEILDGIIKESHQQLKTIVTERIEWDRTLVIKCNTDFMEGRYDRCIGEAMKQLEIKLRKGLGLDESFYGQKLNDEAKCMGLFGSMDGKNFSGPLANENLGTYLIYKGFIAAYRNPPDHREIDMTADETIAILAHINKMYKDLDVMMQRIKRPTN